MRRLCGLGVKNYDSPRRARVAWRCVRCEARRFALADVRRCRACVRLRPRSASEHCTGNDADALLDFSDTIRAVVSTCLVACDEGEGRSRGVALAVALIYGDASEHLATGRPNTHVVHTILARAARRTGSTLAMPCIVRYARRCPLHLRRAVSESIASGDACDLCGRRLEPVPIDIATDTVLVRAGDEPVRRVFAAS